MKVRTLVVDDEDSARSRLKRLLGAFDDVVIEGEACNGLEAVEAIERIKPDLVFLDVQMPGLDGIEVLRALPTNGPMPLVIFATAFDQYALAAFDANAIAYLLKPIDRAKLQDAISRAQEVLSGRHASSEDARLRALMQTSQSQMEVAVAQTRDRYLLVPLAEVLFFRVDDGITKLKTATALHRTNYQIGDLETRLPDPPFFRAHRSVIVNMRHVAEINPMFNGSYLLVMKDAERSEVQVSERQSKILRELLKL